MNIDTGELRLLTEKALIPEGFFAVPKELEEEALNELGDRQSVFVDLKSNTPLAQFAQSQRAQRKKSRKKMAKASKRRNRR